MRKTIHAAFLAALVAAVPAAAQDEPQTAAEFRKQLDGTVLENATGLLSWRDFKFKTR